MDREVVTKTVIAALGTAATYLWGGWDAVFTALVVLACMDYITGWAAAWVHRRCGTGYSDRGPDSNARAYLHRLQLLRRWCDVQRLGA